MKRILQLILRRRLYRDISDEMRSHIEERIDELIESGLSPQDAAAAARRQFGNPTLIEERSREAWGWASLERLANDARYALRVLSKTPAFTLTAILTLALGIGANTAIFSVVDTVLLRPLPYKDPGRLVVLETTNQVLGVRKGPASFLDYSDWRASGIFEEIALYHAGDSVIQLGSGDSQRVSSVAASASLYPLLGTQPLLGRLPAEQEDRAGASPVALLSERIWRREFGADPSIVGRNLRVEGKPVLVIGVLPASFLFEGDRDLWITFDYSDNLLQRQNRFLSAIARLRPGQSLEQSHARLSSLCESLAKQFPRSNHDWNAAPAPLQESEVGDVRTQLLVLLGAVSLVLLIGCANIAVLHLVRGAGRVREIGLRTALGASRRRIVAQLLMESSMVSIAGCGLGVALAIGCVSLLVKYGPQGIPRLATVHVDLRVLLFVVGLSALTTIVFGLGPALQLSRADPNSALREGGKSATAGRERALLRGALLVAETSLSLFLLVGAALLVKSFLRLITVHPGFRADHLLTFYLPLPNSKYIAGTKYKREYVEQYYAEVLERVARLPQVQAAGAAGDLPLGGGGWRSWQGFSIPGIPATAIEKTICVVLPVTPSYFRAMAVPLRAGREFNETDSATGPPVAMVNEAFVRRYFGGQDPIGKDVVIEGAKTPTQVVGVVGSMKPDALDSNPNPEIYRPHAQQTYPFMGIVVRTRVDPLSVVPSIRAELMRLDREVPPHRIRSGDQLLSRSVSERRFAVTLMTAFAAIALALALIGLYGVISYSVAQSTREIGIRMALGAKTGNVLSLVLGRTLTLCLLGVAIGLVLSVGFTRLLTRMLFEVKPLDPVVLALVPIGLAAVSVLACLIPARRAARVDPTVALRYE